MKQEISKLLNKYFTTNNFRIVLSNKFTIGSFFRFKEKLPLSMVASVIYQFSCSQCESCYVGMTSRNIYKRVAEHAGVSFRTGARLSQPPHSAVREHANNCNTPVSLDSFKILNSASNPSDLRIIESLYIFKLKPPLNNTLSSYPLRISNQ